MTAALLPATASGGGGSYLPIAEHGRQFDSGLRRLHCQHTYTHPVLRPLVATQHIAPAAAQAPATAGWRFKVG
jgi:hypothetical protein